jgi:vesicle transport protein SEC22
MALFTLITRVSDGMPFMESTECPSQQIKDQAKSIAKRLDAHSATRLRIDCGGQQITYLLEEGLCFLVVTDTSYPQRLTLSYLISLHKAFTQHMRDQDGDSWRARLDTCASAYAYQGFTSAKLVQLRRDYADPSSKSNAARLTEELQDVHSIMRKNIQEVLQRGENLDRE